MAKKHGQGSPVAENGDAIGDVAGHAIAARTESSEAAARCAAIPRNDDGSVGTIKEHLDRIWFSAKAVIAPPRWPWPRSSAVTTAMPSSHALDSRAFRNNLYGHQISSAPHRRDVLL